MKVLPAIMSARMVRATLDGRKTMTRRLAYRKDGRPTQWLRIHEAFEAGEECLVWVREGWALDVEAAWDPEGRGAYYRADPDAEEIAAGNRACGIPHEWRSPIHMPRWASRITGIIAATKVERVQDISEADARAEGFLVDGDGQAWGVFARDLFEDYWDTLHGAGAWARNPEVVAVRYVPIHKNIYDVVADLKVAR